LQGRCSASIACGLALAFGLVRARRGVWVSVGPMVRIVAPHHERRRCGHRLAHRRCPSQDLESGGKPCPLTRRCSAYGGVKRVVNFPSAFL
jgi:hypothetical protein